MQNALYTLASYLHNIIVQHITDIDEIFTEKINAALAGSLQPADRKW